MKRLQTVSRCRLFNCCPHLLSCSGLCRCGFEFVQRYFTPENKQSPQRFPVLALVIFILVAFVSAAPFTAYTVLPALLPVSSSGNTTVHSAGKYSFCTFWNVCQQGSTLSIASDVISIILPTSPIQELFPVLAVCF